MRILYLLATAALSGGLWAQESELGADFRQEGESFQEDCIGLKLAGCGELLVIGSPLHVAAGSLAPQNGFGAGLALTTHYTPNERWRLFGNADAVAAPNGSWRAGGYLSAVLIRHEAIKPHPDRPGGKASRLSVREMPVFHAYAQAISLNSIPYYGLGPGTGSQPSFFGMTETIAGGNVEWPLFDPLKLSLFGEANGRFFSLRGASGTNKPSIELVNNSNTAPGLLQQPGYAQFGQGIEMHPSFANGYIRLNYAVTLQEWAASDSTYSFRRFKTDLSQQFPLYRSTRSFLPRGFNGPDTCAEDSNSLKCPPVSRNLEGSFELRFLYTTSYTSSGSVVPFYLDPTLGGSDINGTALLSSFSDYRFRAPNLIVFRAAFEHSIYKWPVGVKVLMDEGRVGLRPGDLGLSHLVHSYAAGLTVRAGGLPVVDLLFAWGGEPGTHTIAAVSPSLLGGTARPSLF
jgi:hypothetical protein